jgi:hypothetical protein
MRVHYTVCCGIDVHKNSVTACLMWGAGGSGATIRDSPIRDDEFRLEEVGRMAQTSSM